MVHYTLGKIYMQTTQYDSAKRQFLLELPWSQFSDIYYNLGLIYSRQKNIDSTIFYFEKVVSLEPDHPNTPSMQGTIRSLQLQHFMDKAQAAVQANEPDTAASWLQKVILLDPGNAQAHYNLALLYYNMKQKEKAREVIAQMQSRGMTISPELLKLVQQ
jgi:tetratricopeptide (TPR) repeat protein